MDKATAARRVRALRAMSVDPSATVSERAAHKAKADELEAKYGKAEPRSVYIPRHNNPTMTYSEYLAWMYASGDLPREPRERPEPTVKEHPWSTPSVRLYVVTDDIDDLVEDGYLWAPSDDDDPSY